MPKPFYSFSMDISGIVQGDKRSTRVLIAKRLRMIADRIQRHTDHGTVCDDVDYDLYIDWEAVKPNDHEMSNV